MALICMILIHMTLICMVEMAELETVCTVVHINLSGLEVCQPGLPSLGGWQFHARKGYIKKFIQTK